MGFDGWGVARGWVLLGLAPKSLNSRKYILDAKEALRYGPTRSFWSSIHKQSLELRTVWPSYFVLHGNEVITSVWDSSTASWDQLVERARCIDLTGHRPRAPSLGHIGHRSTTRSHHRYERREEGYLCPLSLLGRPPHDTSFLSTVTDNAPSEIIASAIRTSKSSFI